MKLTRVQFGLGVVSLLLFSITLKLIAGTFTAPAPVTGEVFVQAGGGEPRSLSGLRVFFLQPAEHARWVTYLKSWRSTAQARLSEQYACKQRRAGELLLANRRPDGRLYERDAVGSEYAEYLSLRDWMQRNQPRLQLSYWEDQLPHFLCHFCEEALKDVQVTSTDSRGQFATTLPSTKNVWIYCIADPEMTKNANGYRYRVWYLPLNTKDGRVILTEKNCRVQYRG